MAIADLSTSRISALFLLGASAGSLLAAFFFQYVIGLQPCVLCIWQRWPYAVVIALSIVYVGLVGVRGRPAGRGAGR